MPRLLPRENATDDDGDPVRDWIQFRGRQTSVTVDAYGLQFTTERRNGGIAHKPLPVIDDDADPSDAPDDAVIRSIADHLVDTNPLVCYGVACETCGQVFPSPDALSGHQQAHAAADDVDEEQEGNGAE